MKIMSVDFGDSRTGIAVCDKSEFLASPLTVIFEKNFDRCLEKTADLAKQEQAELIVVGFPKNMNNTVGERAEKCTLFGDRLHEMTGIEVVMWDERLTTNAAEQILIESGVRRENRKSVIDKIAAVLILQGYLDLQAQGKVEE